jgi:hypothetical protein
MQDNDTLEIYRLLTVGQSKYTCFILAVAAAAVAYSVKLTESSVLSDSMIPLGLATLFWGVSFYCGCRSLRYSLSNLHANLELNLILDGTHSKVGRDPSAIKAASKGITDAWEYNANKGMLHAKMQTGFLIAGALCFIAWHLTEMIVRGMGK